MLIKNFFNLLLKSIAYSLMEIIMSAFLKDNKFHGQCTFTWINVKHFQGFGKMDILLKRERILIQTEPWRIFHKLLKMERKQIKIRKLKFSLVVPSA